MSDPKVTVYRDNDPVHLLPSPGLILVVVQCGKILITMMVSLLTLLRKSHLPIHLLSHPNLLPQTAAMTMVIHRI